MFWKKKKRHLIEDKIEVTKLQIKKCVCSTCKYSKVTASYEKICVYGRQFNCDFVLKAFHICGFKDNRYD